MGLNKKGDLLQTESVRVPVDDHIPTRSRIEAKIRPELAVEEAKARFDKENKVN